MHSLFGTSATVSVREKARQRERETGENLRMHPIVL